MPDSLAKKVNLKRLISTVLSAAILNLLQHPMILHKLDEELRQAIPDPSNPPPLTTLEQLPYLTGVLWETLRLHYGVSTRLQRVAHTSLDFTSGTGPFGSGSGQVFYVIPARTSVGMSAALIHKNPAIFPEPDRFLPERWLRDFKRLSPYILSFSKGSRQCAGINLAFAELYMTLAVIVRQFGRRMKLFETDSSDMVMDGDYILPLPKKESKGVRVVIHRD